MLRALTRLLDHKIEHGDRDGAIAIALRLLDLDPLQERVHRSLMRLHTEAGQRNTALKQYQHCRALLERELSVVNAEVNFPTLGEVIFPTRRGSGDRPGLDQRLSFRGLPRCRFGG
jgi:DNA-binding SARP family transcriptional activator